MLSTPTGATRVKRQERPLATARLVASPTLAKSVAPGAGASPSAAEGAGATELPSALIMPKAERSMPTGCRPASRSGRREASIMSRRAATTTTSIFAAPSSSPTPPTTRWSSTAWSRGIGTCSWAWKRTAASSSSGSSIAGRRRVRTTTRWLAMPSRTFFESLFSA